MELKWYSDTIYKNISEIIVHPKYDINKLNFDIALLKVFLFKEGYGRVVCLNTDRVPELNQREHRISSINCSGSYFKPYVNSLTAGV